MSKIKTILIAVKNNITFSKVILTIIALGFWILVLQNLGIIPISPKEVIVVKGSIKVSGQVKVKNNTDVETLNVNLQDINGQQDVFFNNPSRGYNYKYYEY